MAAANPMRVLRPLLCLACGHHWTAPVFGACPQCGSGGAAADPARIVVVQVAPERVTTAIRV